MQRNEFDQRRALHGLYAGLLDGGDVAARFADPAHPVRRVSADVDLDANGTVPLVEVRHRHLQRAIVQPDVKFGDSVTPELYRQWAAQVGLDQGVSSQGRLDELYMSFHERQHAELSALGRSRIEAAKAFMDGIVEREALRHAASSLGADTSLYSGQTGMQAGYHRMSDGRLMSSTQHGMGTPSDGDTASNGAFIAVVCARPACSYTPALDTQCHVLVLWRGQTWAR